ncbi:MAG TPA: TetR/AcrR family transcriptional regulator [Anaerolineae bacterium]|nr:TetR/AcrR family transcriptional regulator [Anaerolineae bacterium]
MTDQPSLTRGERTRREILDAARTLFLAQGYSATGMRQIARSAGITPAAIYNHFASKDDLFTSLLRREAPFEQLLVLWSDSQAGTAKELLERVFRGCVDLFSAHQGYIRLALIDAQEREGAAITTFVPQLAQGAMGFYQRMVALDEAQGQLRPMPPFVFLRALVSLIGGYVLMDRLARPSETLQLPSIDWAQELTDVFLHGVLNPPAASES